MRAALGPFVASKCAALGETLIEAELFGHVEAADGGTVFLNEITQITPSVQAKLLRTLQHDALVLQGSCAAGVAGLQPDRWRPREPDAARGSGGAVASNIAPRPSTYHWGLPARRMCNPTLKADW